MKTSTLALSLFCLFAFGLDSQAARRDNRQNKQSARIKQGVESGELNKREARRLNRNQKKIERTEDRMESDGEMTGKEKARLENMQDRASKRIHRQKNDGQERKDGAEDSAGEGAAE